MSVGAHLGDGGTFNFTTNFHTYQIMDDLFSCRRVRRRNDVLGMRSDIHIHGVLGGPISVCETFFLTRQIHRTG